MPDNIDQIGAAVMFALLFIALLVTFVHSVVRSFNETKTPAPAPVKASPKHRLNVNDEIARMEMEERKQRNLDRVLNSDNPL